MSQRPKSRRKETQTHWYHPAVPAEPLPRATAPKPRLARERVQRRRTDQRLPRPDWTWAVIGLALAGVVGLVALVMLSTVGGANAGAPAIAQAEQTTSPDSADPAGAQAVAAPLTLPEIRAWDGTGRFTVLVMGIDKRPGERGTGFRTDTLILVSLNPATRQIGMLSLPRDLKVPIPGRAEMQYINAAYVVGELERPGFGPRLTADTIQYNLGMKVDHYVVLSFEAVIALVDAIGGITVEVPSQIVDHEYPDMFYGVETLVIPAGTIQMDGQLALKYARTRHQTDDFDRTRRQQQIILAIRQKALRPDMLPQLLARAPMIWETVSKGVITDLTFEQILSLAWYVKDIPDGSLKRGTMDDRYIRATKYQGETILTINRDTVAELLVSLFGPDYSR